MTPYEISQLQYLAGSISSMMFAAGSLPMVIKAARTRNLKSYSLGNILISNAANLLYWFYLTALPPGPVWYLHAFNSAVTFIMLVFYLVFEKGCGSAAGMKCREKFPACLTT